MLNSLKRAARDSASLSNIYARLRQVRHSFWEPDFNSPIPSLKEVKKRETEIWGDIHRHLPSIDLNEKRQQSLFGELKRFYADIPFCDLPRNGLRYHFHNDWFGDSDAILLYSMIRHLRPKRIIEIGSGFSSAVMLDTNDLFCDGEIACTFIEPYPQRLLSLLDESDRKKHTIINKEVQDVDLEVFESLGPNDILFIDSSHVSKVCSDVNYLFFRVLPVLASGVYVQIHDVFYPFEYPQEWVRDGKAWNETYLTRAFLQYNSAFSVQFFNSFMTRYFRDRFQQDMPRWIQDPPDGLWSSSLWLRKS